MRAREIQPYQTRRRDLAPIPIHAIDKGRELGISAVQGTP